MSETKGRLGWMTGPALDTWANKEWVAASKQGAYCRPVWITALPEWALPAPQFQVGQEVEWAAQSGSWVVDGPPYWSGHYECWLVPLRGGPAATPLALAYEADLSPIPSTRTVTVELTEREREFMEHVLSGRDARKEVAGIYAKLLAALKDS